MLEWMLLPFKRYFDFSGRSRRKEYWSFALLNVIVVIVFYALLFAGGMSMSAMEAAQMGGGGFQLGAVGWLAVGLIVLWGLGSIIPSLALTIRRLHDRNLSGWFLLGYVVLSLIPFINFIVAIAMLVLMCLEGTKGPNKYGPDPKDPASAEVFA